MSATDQAALRLLRHLARRDSRFFALSELCFYRAVRISWVRQ